MLRPKNGINHHLGLFSFCSWKLIVNEFVNDEGLYIYKQC
jgi:hypothetical protein